MIGLYGSSNNALFHIRHCNLLNDTCKYTKLSFIAIRKVYSETGKWVKKYKKETRIDLEKHWVKQLSEQWKQAEKKPSNFVAKKKFYCLSMFPYPSGKLHMGHVRVYTISDTMAHFYRMQGKEVVHPMGWDSFGLPAENAAISNNLDPEQWTKKNIADMKQQLIDLNLFFDWKRELSTCTPEYYKWTQYLFVKLFQAGLAYQKKALVNWDPVDNTVLANEQRLVRTMLLSSMFNVRLFGEAALSDVDDEGKSWRSGALVEKRLLKQWFLRTSKYAESLLNTIDEIDEHVGIKSMQRHWIGNIEGCFVDFKLEVNGLPSEDGLSVFCSHPELLPTATHINLHPDHIEEFSLLFNDAGRTSKFAELNVLKNGEIVDGVSAINPFTDEKITFVVSDHYGKTFRASAVLGLPSVNDTDAEIAVDNHWKVEMQQDQLSRKEALNKIQSLGCGHDHMTSSNVGDWLISRQRRWGTPIPIIYCTEHGVVCVPEEDLPVILPKYDEKLENWKKTTCPKCGKAAVRETDTMDTFVDSSWYFMRYTDPHNQNEIFSKSKCDALMPVDLYIGGKEHAILHLYYARFINHFCADIGLTTHREPFKKLLAQGIIKGKTYRSKTSGKYLRPDEVEEKEDGAVEKSSGESVEIFFDKMSKSKLNGVDPVEFVSEWGITLTRLFVLYAASPPEVIHWDTKTDVIPGMMRWQMKLWKNVGRLLDARKQPPSACNDFDTEFHLTTQTNRTIEQVTNLLDGPCTISAAITFLMTLARRTVEVKDHVIPGSREFERCVCDQVIMTAPLMPHFASELWTGLCGMKYKMTDYDWEKGVLSQSWPKVEEVSHKLVDVWVDKKLCTKLYLPSDFDDENIPSHALKHPKVAKRIKSSVSETLVQPNCVKFFTKPKIAS